MGWFKKHWFKSKNAAEDGGISVDETQKTMVSADERASEKLEAGVTEFQSKVNDIKAELSKAVDEFANSRAGEYASVALAGTKLGLDAVEQVNPHIPTKPLATAVDLASSRLKQARGELDAVKKTVAENALEKGLGDKFPSDIGVCQDAADLVESVKNVHTTVVVDGPIIDYRHGKEKHEGTEVSVPIVSKYNSEYIYGEAERIEASKSAENSGIEASKGADNGGIEASKGAESSGSEAGTGSSAEAGAGCSV